ncbi:MAG TPA: lytic transglycosylase [Pseudomonas sp.]|nr:lytic transglycosylase [Pseudomonas sp.]
MAAPRLSLLLLALLGSAQARELPPTAYQLIARQAGIPAEVLYAIALQESALPLRGQLRPWPWTLNVAGRPLRFTSQPAACHALHRALATNAPTRIDIGLAQINWGYHGHRFASPCAALHPTLNLTVAAHLLRDHHRHSGDWLLAAGRYHRPAGGTPASRYRAGVARHLARLQFPLHLASDAHP